MLTDSNPSLPTQSERNWAMLAHLSALLTLVVGAYTGGAAAVLALLLPLGMYVYFAGRSRFVAFHALQSTVFQAIGAILFVALAAATASAIALVWVITGLLSIILIGLLLIPAAFGLTLLGAFELAAFPLIVVGYTVLAAYRAHAGEDFKYPWIGALVERALGPAAPTVPPAPPLSAAPADAVGP